MIKLSLLIDKLDKRIINLHLSPNTCIIICKQDLKNIAKDFKLKYSKGVFSNHYSLIPR